MTWFDFACAFALSVFNVWSCAFCCFHSPAIFSTMKWYGNNVVYARECTIIIWTEKKKKKEWKSLLFYLSEMKAHKNDNGWMHWCLNSSIYWIRFGGEITICFCAYQHLPPTHRQHIPTNEQCIQQTFSNCFFFLFLRISRLE